MSEKVHKALRRLIDKRQVAQLITGTVVKVSGHACDVDPDDGGPTLFDVRLKVALNSVQTGFYAIPKNGSRVVLGVIDGDGNKMVVLGVETPEKLIAIADGDASVELLPGGIVKVNGDSYGGLVKVQELRSELQKVTTFLTTIRQAIAAAPVAPNDGGASFKASVSTALSSLQLPTYQQIESTKVKHGGV